MAAKATSTVTLYNQAGIIGISYFLCLFVVEQNLFHP